MTSHHRHDGAKVVSSLFMGRSPMSHAGGKGDIEMQPASSMLRRRSSILLRSDMTQASTLGSQHSGHSSWITASGHLITAIIGAGVLGLPYSIAWLGWIGGALSMVTFYVITVWCMRMLAEVYEVKGRRHTRYSHAVLFILGSKAATALSVFQHATMILVSCGYHIAAADSMGYVATQFCEISGNTHCFNTPWVMAILFGGVQLLMSQLPNLESAWWASIIGALMSLGYSGIAIGLGASQAHHGLGTIQGRVAPPLDKMFGIFNSLGTISASFSCAIVLIEIQDTLREPPKAAISMKKSLNAGLGLTFVIYIAVSFLGYAALGDAVPGNILLGFSSAPKWIGILGNITVLIHMIPAYQVFAQPVYATIEDKLLLCFPSLVHVRELFIRLVYRSIYVVMTTTVAAAIPFFSSFVGLIGAISYLPTSVLFPVMMFRAVYKPTGRVVWLMNGVCIIMGLVALAAVVGSLASIVASASSMKPFGGGGGHGR